MITTRCATIAADCSSRRTLVYSRIISTTHDPNLLIFVMIHGWVFAFRCVRYACVMYVTCMYRQHNCQAPYVLYSCDRCVINYMCGTMAYSILVSARWSNYFADRKNDVTYLTQFQGHFQGLCNINRRKILLNSVIINIFSHTCSLRRACIVLTIYLGLIPQPHMLSKRMTVFRVLIVTYVDAIEEFMQPGN